MRKKGSKLRPGTGTGTGTKTETTVGQTPAGETPAGETPAGEKTPAGETPAGETPAGETFLERSGSGGKRGRRRLLANKTISVAVVRNGAVLHRVDAVQMLTSDGCRVVIRVGAEIITSLLTALVWVEHQFGDDESIALQACPRSVPFFPTTASDEIRRALVRGCQTCCVKSRCRAPRAAGPWRVPTIELAR
jgi:hypothetical protein